MTSPRRFDGELPALLAELYLAGTPVYRDDLVQQIARTPQRHAWTFPGRWLPMELVTTRVPATRLPMRQLGVLALIAILLAAALVVYVGSQQMRLPAPFGVAGNGLIAYSADGDILVSDPTGSGARAITAGPGIDTDPMFSPDGQRIAFLRSTPGLTGLDLMVVDMDGGQPIKVSAEPLRFTEIYEWAPDSRWLILNSSDRRLMRLDATDPGEPALIATDAILSRGASVFRPPDGKQIMFMRGSAGGLWVLDVDGKSKPRLLIDNPEPENRDFTYARWSPDGTMIAFPATIGDGEQYRIHVAQADGTAIRRVSTAEGTFVEADLRWSPDGSRIAFNRWGKPPNGAWQVRPIAVVTVATGEDTETGSVGVSQGTLLEWSPDGGYVIGVPGLLAGHGSTATAKPVIVDVTTGVESQLPWTVRTNVSWQRVVP
jgi:Tol biopolymer transport system component